MRRLTLRDLPPPPAGKTGWPWTVESAAPPEFAPDGRPWPKISVVTPSFNQAQFIEETIRSVLLQNYPDIELLVIDGGSTDDTLKVVEPYLPFIAHFVSEKDRGQSHAVNKGLRKATGRLVGWQNSDDTYQPDCFAGAARALFKHPDTSVFYGRLIIMDQDSRYIKEYPVKDFTLIDAFPYFVFANQCIFFKNDIFQAGHFLDESWHFCMDREYYWRLIFAGFQFRFIPDMAGNFRTHPAAKTSTLHLVSERETFRHYVQIFNSGKLPEEVLPHAIKWCRSTIFLCFADGRLDEFRDRVRQFRRAVGFRAYNVNLLFRHALSLTGPRATMTIWNSFKLFKRSDQRAG